MTLGLGAGASEAFAQKARPTKAKTTKVRTARAAARAKAKATRAARPGAKRTRLRGTTKRVGLLGKARATDKTTANPVVKPANTPSRQTKAAAKPAQSAKAKARKAKVVAKAIAKAKAKQAKVVTKAQAKAARAEARKLKKGDAEAKAKEAKEAKRIIPKTKDPIHQKLKDPSFFGEKDAPTGTHTSESLQNGADTLQKLKEPSDLFFSGDVGRLMSARLINRSGRNDADFRYSYGKEAFVNFAKADRILRKIPKGQLASSLDVALLTKINKTAFAEGGDSLASRVGKGLRQLFLPGAKTGAGDLRNYQSYHYAAKGLTPKEAKNIAEHGARYIKLPFLNKGFILYANPVMVKSGLNALIKETRARINDPASDPAQTAGRFVQRFIALHPYADGNGRTARLVMDRILAERSMLPPILKNTGNDIGLSEKAFAKEILNGVARTTQHFRQSGLKNGAGFVERMMKQHGHTVAGIGSQKFAKFDGLSYGLRSDGFVYNSAGRPHLADKSGNLRPISQMTLYILMRRIALHKNAPDILQQITAPTRAAFDKLSNTKNGKGPKILSDLGAIKSDGRIAVNVDGIDGRMLISLLNPKNISTKNLFPVREGSSPLTSVMSRYQQADLELWYVKEAFQAKGDARSVAKIEKHLDALFARSRTELRSRIKKGSKKGDDDNPLGAKHEYERIQYGYSPLRYGKRSEYIKKHGDSEAYIFRGENFAKWTGVHIDGRPFRPGLKDAAAMRAKKQGSLNLFDALKAVEGDTIGTGVQSYTTDLGLLARKGGFADKHKQIKLDLGAMPTMGKALLNLRVKDGESIEVSKGTGLLAALFSRQTTTRKGHFSIKDITATELKQVIERHAPSDKVEALTKAAEQVHGKKGLSIGRIFRGRPSEVNAEGILDATQLQSLNRALGEARNLITARRDGDTLHVTAHRRANVFKVKKQHMLPGIDSLGGTFVTEQEVHVMSTVLPNRLLGTFTQKQLATELGAQAAKEPAVAATATATAAVAGAM